MINAERAGTPWTRIRSRRGGAPQHTPASVSQAAMAAAMAMQGADADVAVCDRDLLTVPSDARDP